MDFIKEQLKIIKEKRAILKGTLWTHLDVYLDVRRKDNCGKKN